MTESNSNHTAHGQQIQIIKSRGVRVPVRLEIYKHGGGIYLTVANPAEGVNVALVASAAEMAATLRRAADQIEAAVRVNDQGHITRERPQPEPGIIHAADSAVPLERLNRIKVEHLAGLTAKQRKALIYLRFKDGGRFRDGENAFEGADGYTFEEWEKYLPSLREESPAAAQSPTPAPRPPAPTSQLDLDLQAIQPALARITQGGKINKSEIARALGITPGGSGNWARLVAVAEALKKAA